MPYYPNTALRWQTSLWFLTLLKENTRHFQLSDPSSQPGFRRPSAPLNKILNFPFSRWSSQFALDQLTCNNTLLSISSPFIYFHSPGAYLSLLHVIKMDLLYPKVCFVLSSLLLVAHRLLPCICDTASGEPCSLYMFSLQASLCRRASSAAHVYPRFLHHILSCGWFFSFWTNREINVLLHTDDLSFISPSRFFAVWSTLAGSQEQTPVDYAVAVYPRDCNDFASRFAGENENRRSTSALRWTQNMISNNNKKVKVRHQTEVVRIYTQRNNRRCGEEERAMLLFSIVNLKIKGYKVEWD